jgi:hypothetical protein
MSRNFQSINTKMYLMPPVDPCPSPDLEKKALIFKA